MSMDVALEIVNYLPNETSIIPYQAFFREFPVKTMETRKLLKTLFQNYKDADMLKISENGTDILTIFIYQKLHHIAPELCDKQMNDIFQKKYLAFCEGETSISSECSQVPIQLRTMAYCSALRIGSKELYAKVGQNIE